MLHLHTGKAEEFHDEFVLPTVRTWEDKMQRADKLKVFAQGESMGGGTLCSLCIRRPKMYDGVILVSPMLGVMPNVRPHRIVEFVFRHIMVSCV